MTNRTLRLGTHIFKAHLQNFEKRLLASSYLVCLSVCLSVCATARLSIHSSVLMEQLGSHWTDFHEI